MTATCRDVAALLAAMRDATRELACDCDGGRIWWEDDDMGLRQRPCPKCSEDA